MNFGWKNWEQFADKFLVSIVKKQIGRKKLDHLHAYGEFLMGKNWNKEFIQNCSLLLKKRIGRKNSGHLTDICWAPAVKKQILAERNQSKLQMIL